MISVFWVSTITVLGKLTRIRNCVAQNNKSYFLRFIFYHALMCSSSMMILSQAFLTEFSYIALLYDLKITERQFWIHLTRFVSLRIEYLFFGLILSVTSITLWLFFSSLLGKYGNGLTINSEYKFEEVSSQFLKKVRKLGKEGGEGVGAIEENARLISEMENWCQKVEQFRGNQSFMKRTFSLLFIS